MLDRKEFMQIKGELDKVNEVTESLYRDSRDLVGLSKKIIYGLHRGKLKESEALAPEIEKMKKRMQSIVKNNQALRRHGPYGIAMQEYVEAASYLSFSRDKTIPTKRRLGVESEEYLSGLCDLTGELVRKAVDLSIKGDTKTVSEIKAFLEEYYSMLLEVNPYGELRKKADQVRWNLNKLEDLVYEQKSRGR